MHLLTDKPFIYVFNVDEETLGDEARRAALAASVAPSPQSSSVPRSKRNCPTWTRMRRSNSSSPTGKRSRPRAAVTSRLRDPRSSDLSHRGPKETRAWTIHQGATAPRPPRDSHRLPEALHQGRGRLLRRPHVTRFDAQVKPRARRVSRQGIRHARCDVVEFRVGV